MADRRSPTCSARPAAPGWPGSSSPSRERETVKGCLRQLDFLDGEIELVDGKIAEYALGSAEPQRLMTIPGVDVTTAAALMAAIGDIARFPPRASWSPTSASTPSSASPAGAGPPWPDLQARDRPRHGIALVEAAWSRDGTRPAARLRRTDPRPPRRQIAAVAVARKLAVVAWHLLTRDEDYAYERPRLTCGKLRRLDCSPAPQPAHPDPVCASAPPSEHERRASAAGRARLPATRHRLASDRRRARARHRGAHLLGPLRASSAAGVKAPAACALARRSPAPHPNCLTEEPPIHST